MHLEAPEFSNRSETGTQGVNAGRFGRFKALLLRGGTRPFDFGVVFVPMAVLACLAIVGLALYPLDLTFLVEFTFFGAYVKWELSLNFVIAAGVLVLALIFTPYYMYLGIAREKLRLNPVKRLSDKFRINLLGYADGWKYFFTTIVIAEFFYYYDYELYYPTVIGTFSLFGIAGAVIYWIFGRFRGAKPAMVMIAIASLVINIFVVYQDSSTNAYNYWSGTTDAIFPFAYLHGLVNLASTGMATGIMFCDLIHSAGFNNAGGGGDSTNRGILIAMAFLLDGLFIMLLGTVLDSPGGEPAGTVDIDPESVIGSIFYWISIVSGTMFAIIAVIHINTEWIVPAVVRKRKREATVDVTRTPSGRPPTMVASLAPFEKKFRAFTLAFIVLCSATGCIAISVSYQAAYQKPVLAYASGNYWMWFEESGERVDKDTLIAVNPPAYIDAVSFSVAKNEYHAFQLVLRSFSTAITNLSCSISDFTHTTVMSNTIPSNACHVRYEQRVLEAEYPDILVPFTTLDLDANNNHVFWISLKTPYNAEAGMYCGQVTFDFSNDIHVHIDVNMNVWNFTIPLMRHLRTNIGPGAGDYQTIDNYAYHRINDYGNDIAATLTGSNNWTFDWTSFDALIQYKLDHGMNGFVAYYYGNRDPPVDDAIEMLRVSNYLKGLEDHLIALNWTRYAYIYFIDEFQMFVPEAYSRSEYFQRLATLLQIMKTAAPNLRIMTTSPPSTETEILRDYIDIYCPIATDYDEQRWEAMKDAGKEMWTYSCVSPGAPWPNSHLYNRLYECRILIWQVWHYKIHGFLYWSSQAYYHGHYGIAYNGYGDGWFLYRDFGNTSGLLDSMRWENYLDGQEDYEYIWLLNATIADLEARGILTGAQAAEKRAAMETTANSIAMDTWHYCDHPATLYEGRLAIGNQLHSLSAFTNITTIGEADWKPLG
jgi:hypothetical protein